jgi:hypothetical protein
MTTSTNNLIYPTPFQILIGLVVAYGSPQDYVDCLIYWFGYEIISRILPKCQYKYLTDKCVLLTRHLSQLFALKILHFTFVLWAVA